MRKISLLFLLFIPLIAAKAQPKKITPQAQGQYLFHINNAKLYSSDSLYKKSCDEYEIAFSYRKDFVIDLFECAKIYDKLNDSKNALKYLQMSIEAGCDWYNDTALLINIRRNHLYPKRSQIEQYRSLYYSEINVDYLLQLENLVAIDQRIRNTKRNDYAQITDAEVESKLMGINDSINMETLKKLIGKYGFPRYSSAGYKGTSDAFVLLLHGLFDGVHDSLDWVYFQPIILNEVKNGNLMPDIYALLYDRVVSAHAKKEQCYGLQYVFNSDGTFGLTPIYDIANVDIRRKEIGLSPLADQLKIAHMKIPDGYVRK